MKIINYKNDNDFLTDGDKEIFGNTVGVSIEDLKDKIKNLPGSKIEEIYGNGKFVFSELNAMGLHVYRILLARKIRLVNKSPSIPIINEFDDNGIIHIENFLSDREFNHVTDYFYNIAAPILKGGGKGKINSDFIMNDNNSIVDLFKACAHVDGFSNDAEDGFPRTEFWHHKHFSNDSQYKYHSDTFHPTIKAWLYLEDVEYEHGPFHYVPESQILNEKRLKWDFENSLISEYGNQHPGWKYRIERNGKPGSFRVCEGASEKDEILTLSKMGYKNIKIMAAPKNTLVIADTFGFHKRGKALPGVMRTTLTMQYRPAAFRCY